MNNGVIMFAHNGQATYSNKTQIEIDYVQMAVANAINIKKYMDNNSVALVTDTNGKQQLEKLNQLRYFEHIIVTSSTPQGKGPNTNQYMNVRGMRAGKENIRLTLSHSYIILDEAQNTTPMQMKMFLTRLGKESKMVITGDLTQIDLPVRGNSGLYDALKVTKSIPGVSSIKFQEKDVIRHPIVNAIVKSYRNKIHNTSSNID